MNQVFYIGIGTNHRSKPFNRAYRKDRNPVWKNIASKTTYDVEIIFESDDINFIKEKEVEFISLYGKICNRTGTLANLTNGGEGRYHYSKSARIATRLSCKHRKRVVHIPTDQIFESIGEAAEKFGIPHNTLIYQLKRKTINCQFRYETEEYVPSMDKRIRSLVNTQTGEVHTSVKMAAESIGMNYGTLRAQLSTNKCAIFKYE